MKPLKVAIHPDLSIADISETSDLKLIERHAARAIIIKGETILLLYTQRYHDYSLPGGGIDEGENQIEGLKRELKEETGAKGANQIIFFARYDEYRPWYHSDADVIHMISHYYTCEIDDELGETAYESHEVSNGMKPLWINIHQAIAHNEDVIANSDKKGLSIDRETFMLKEIAEQLLR